MKNIFAVFITVFFLASPNLVRADDDGDALRTPEEIRLELKRSVRDNLIEAFKNSAVIECISDDLIGIEDPKTTLEESVKIEACVRERLKSALRNVRAIRAGFGTASSRALRNAAAELISQYSSDEDPAE